MDTLVLEFYPTLFVLVTDIMDMLGDLVWQRIKQKAEFAEDGTLCCNLPGFTFSHKLFLYIADAYDISVALFYFILSFLLFHISGLFSFSFSFFFFW